jgi:DNA-binding NtrC family response regulator
LKASASQTIEADTEDKAIAFRAPVPGGVVVFSGEGPCHHVLRPIDGELVLGRTRFGEVGVVDGRVSRNHASCRWEHGLWSVKDLASRNGTTVDARPCSDETRAGTNALVRVGDTLVLLVPDVIPHEERPIRREDDAIVGPRLSAVLDEVKRAGAGSVLHVTGPSGAGKEVVARAFHRLGGKSAGPFIAINCAAIPAGVAERLLFGARKGAFSGAHADAPGHVQEADGGTLFLDEVGELDLEVQAKLLRVLDAREVIALGASRPRPVDIQLVSATHRDLRELVAARKFREDLYFRIARPSVTLAPLASRREEIPFLVEDVCRRRNVVPHASLVEACLMRRWPGNVRELIAEVSAATTSSAVGEDGRVRAAALATSAGLEFAGAEDTKPRSAEPADDSPKQLPSRAEIEAALQRHNGRVASAARDLDVHRNQLRRWLTKEGIDPRTFGSDES